MVHNIPHTLESRLKVSQGLLSSDKQIGRKPGYHHSEETLEKLRSACRGAHMVHFGVHVAETLFQEMYPDAKPTGFKTRGYDFTLDGKKIDIKASTIVKAGGWRYQIGKNQIADFFVLMAFDNAKDHNLLYLWLIPGCDINHLTSLSVSEGTKSKWGKYRIDFNQ